MNLAGTSREAIQLIEQIIGEENERIDKAAFASSRDGTMTGDKAMAAFVAKEALQNVLKRLRQLDQAGQSAARRVAQRERAHGFT